MPDEHATIVPGLPQLETLRKGQRAVAELFLAGADSVVAKLPTGYGKTRAIAWGFAIAAAQGRAEILLHIVPSTEQAAQARKDIPDDLAKLGIETQAAIVGDETAYLLKHFKRGHIKVLVATIQSLLHEKARSAIRDLLGRRKVMVAADEYHHYGAGKAWFDAIQAIDRDAFMAVSATPDRPGEHPPWGAPMVSVSYLEAVEEGAVKPLICHAADYRIDFISGQSGDVESFTTAELIAEVGSDDPEAIERWRVMRNARCTTAYVSPLVRQGLERLTDDCLAYGQRCQMIVFTMFCSHAKSVCDLIRTQLPPGMSVDWVGTGAQGRSDAENKRVIDAFCPPKDKATGRRPFTLDVLVAVDKAGEGLDAVDVTAQLYLCRLNINNKAKHKIGRGSRRMGRPT